MVVLDVAVCLEVPEQGVDFVLQPVLRRFISKLTLVDVYVTEQEQTVRAVARVVVDQQCMTAEFRWRNRF